MLLHLINIFLLTDKDSSLGTAKELISAKEDNIGAII